MAADGSIVFDVSLDDKQAQQELNRLNRKIQTINDNIYKKQQERMPLVEQARELGAQLDAAKAKLDGMHSGAEFYTTSEIKQQEETVKSIQKEWDGINRKIESCDSYIQKQNVDLDMQKEKYGEIEQRLVSASNESDYMAAAVYRAGKYMDKFTSRIKDLARRVFVFALITAALRSLRTWLGKAIKTNSEATAAIARFKGALLTLAQPLLNVIIPAFTGFVNILAKIVSAAASVMSALFGTTVEQSAQAAENLYNEQQAIEGVGGSAKKASKQLASFDEINKLGDDSDSSGGSSNSAITPDFSVVDMYSERFKEIATAVALIGAGLGLWKISSILPEQFAGIATKLAGIAIAIGGLILLWDGLSDAWKSGVDWGNLAEMIGGATAAIGGLYLAFGKLGAGIGALISGIAMFVTAIKDIITNGASVQNVILAIASLVAIGGGLYTVFGKVAAGIGLVVAGAITIVAAFKDIIDNGANLKNSLLLIAGIVATGLGFMFLTGSIVPAFIAGIAAIAANIMLITGNLDEFAKNLKDNILGGIIDFVTGVFTGDWEKAWNGVAKIFKGIWNGIVIILESAINLVIKGINWLIEKLNTVHFETPDWLPGIGGKSFGFNIPAISNIQLPRLATGAVIPPNREFLAVLGDQKQGTNIEAPLETLVQAFKIAAQEIGGGSGGDTTIIMEVDGQRFAKLVYNANKKESGRVGVRLVEV
ncbi:hypothetical protein [Dysosmobacter sp.]